MYVFIIYIYIYIHTYSGISLVLLYVQIPVCIHRIFAPRVYACMYMYVCGCRHMYVCMCVNNTCANAIRSYSLRRYPHAHVRYSSMHTYCVCMFACMHACVNCATRTCPHARTQTDARAHARTCAHTQPMHARTHTHTHTQRDTHLWHEPWKACMERGIESHQRRHRRHTLLWNVINKNILLWHGTTHAYTYVIWLPKYKIIMNT